MWGLILVILLVVFIAFWLFKTNQYDTYKVSKDTFMIEKYSPSKEESLQALVVVRRKLDSLVEHLVQTYPEDPFVKRLKTRFKDTVLREANPDGDPSQTSYTINKGDAMVICLRTKDGRMVDINTLSYVAIHELAHIYSSSYHHNAEFWRNMKFLINEATKIRLYKKVNYNKNPQQYCGIVIASNIPDKYPASKPGSQSGGGFGGGGGGGGLIEHLLAHSFVMMG